MERVTKSGMQIDAGLYRFVSGQVLPGTGVEEDRFWSGYARILEDFTERNRALLARRDSLQAQIDDWHRVNPEHNPAAYREFLTGIGYLQRVGEVRDICPRNVDPEITSIAGPQLVVPVMNARFALNAANARWGSLYDALYGSDALSGENGAERGADYNPVRGKQVIAWGREFLDQVTPLQGAAHATVDRYQIRGSELLAKCEGEFFGLTNPRQFVGYRGEPASPRAILLVHNSLHLEILIDPDDPVGSGDRAAVRDICLESAITTIQDCEDSVAAVDAEDKVAVYSNWLGLMQGTLEATYSKGGASHTRRLKADRIYRSPDGGELVLPGRSLLLVRNVGHLMTNSAVLDAEGNETFEGIMDALMTSAIALHDLRGGQVIRNSRAGSIYVVKPKMHGPEEVRFSCDLFAAVEEVLGLEHNTIKIGIMDEERRMTVNLDACIQVARERVVFINTGFLDRTGDEIHTSMLMGPMLRKEDIKQQVWINAYENRNVDVGLAAGFSGRAQIGKGMWPKPDEMAEMMRTKSAHPQAGANTAWVPSPTAATLHALHYHQIDVLSRQRELAGRQQAALDDILRVPVKPLDLKYTAEDIQKELDNNIQGILGYVVRWIDQGVGCSKVPDIDNVGLMEDRATLRISSQHLCNWLEHGICTQDQVRKTFVRMAAVVDGQNSSDPAYRPMSADLDNSHAFQAACDLVFRGKEQPNGYTEPLLHKWRRKFKSEA